VLHISVFWQVGRFFAPQVLVLSRRLLNDPPYKVVKMKEFRMFAE
jgi:hypothetical protein